MNSNENDKTNLYSDEALLRFLVPAASRQSAFSLRQAQDEGGAECPRSEDYIHLTMGFVPGPDAEVLISHAAECERCGQLLAANLTALEGNPSQQETEAIAELAAQQEWQRGLARQLAETPARRIAVLPALRPRKVWIMAGGIAAGLAAVGSFLVWQTQRNTPEHQLAMAYTRSRTLELRIPDAGFSNVVAGAHTRGVADDQESSPLLEARAKVARELERNPQSSRWLDLQARADLLEEHYDSAIEVLDRLIAVGPVTAELLTDGATAYYQRGLVSGSEIDRSTALDYLRRADTMAPTDPVILFNEAIVMEDRGQMMNAVEVWNRYITVERDEKWRSEGKRKLGALEQTLNRLKSHQSRLLQMLATPQTMDGLARDPHKLAAWDEELSSMELDKLIPLAFPVIPATKGLPWPRGSPPGIDLCPASCSAARRLLKALAVSLEQQHHDFWLSDLLLPNLNSLPFAATSKYAEAMQALAQATREDQTGLPPTGATLSLKAKELFHDLRSSQPYLPSMATAARVGELRSAIEYMFALQRSVDFKDCRTFSQALRRDLPGEDALSRYVWMNSVAAMTEKVCDDTAVTRPEGQSMVAQAMKVAVAGHYPYLISRARMREVDDMQNSGDVEGAEQATLEEFLKLVAMDAPAIRIANTLPGIEEAENDSPRIYMQDLAQRESLAWFHVAGNPLIEIIYQVSLSRSELKIGNIRESERLLALTESQMAASQSLRSASSLLSEGHIFLADTMLENGNFAGAQKYLQRVGKEMGSYSDNWGLHTFAGAQGLLALDQGDLESAARILETQILRNEGSSPSGADAAQAASYAQLDHDLYAELAATWLAQGRPADTILALWEHFRLRSRGLASDKCSRTNLDCDRERLLGLQRQLGSNVVVGQIVLLDRVLIYRMDGTGIQWTQKACRRQELMAAVANLQRSVNSPHSSLSYVEQLGSLVSDILLPELPAGSANGETSLLLESDPTLQNLPWPVIPTPKGPLGLAYPIAELRSILAVPHAQTHYGNEGEKELIIGASVAQAGEPPLPEAMEEARTVSRYAHAPELLVGKHATAYQVAQALDSASMLHFAGHAVQNRKGTELLLASASSNDRAPWIDGAFLRRHPPLSCKLAVLSACATGRHDASWNSPAQDIVETLGALGVPDVVATRWQIDSSAAVPFMDTFYGNLARGKSVSVALSDARKLQSMQSHDNSPYYWAAYYVTETENISTERRQHGRE